MSKESIAKIFRIMLQYSTILKLIIFVYSPFSDSLSLCLDLGFEYIILLRKNIILMCSIVK